MNFVRFSFYMMLIITIMKANKDETEHDNNTTKQRWQEFCVERNCTRNKVIIQELVEGIDVVSFNLLL